MSNEILFTTSQAAKFLGVSKAYLERDRWRGAIVPFIRLGSRAIRYKQTDLENFIADNRVDNFQLESRNGS